MEDFEQATDFDILKAPLVPMETFIDLFIKVQESVKRNWCGGLPLSAFARISGAFFRLSAYAIVVEGLRIALQSA
jgi:hypothetical protein